MQNRANLVHPDTAEIRPSKRFCKQPPPTPSRPSLPRGELKSDEAHVHAAALPSLVLVDARDVAERGVHGRQVVVLEEVLDEELPVGCDVVGLLRGDAQAAAVERWRVPRLEL